VTVLILAQEFDPTADAVVGALARRQVPVFRTDLSDFPSSIVAGRAAAGRTVVRPVVE
jgi:hypothetical protein